MVDQRILDYVKNTYNKGFSEEHIRLYLSGKGINNNELDEVFALIRPKLGLSKTTHHRWVVFEHELRNLLANFWFIKNPFRILNTQKFSTYEKKIGFQPPVKNWWKISDIFKKAALVFRNPNKLFDYVKSEPQKNSWQYFLIIFVIFSLLILIPFYIDRNINELKGFKVLEFNISNYLTIVAGTFLILFFFAIIMDFFTHYFYGKGIHENFRIMIYSITPISLFIWIPYFGAIVSFYSIFLLIVGIKKLHDFTIKKSIITLLLVILTIIGILSLIYIFSYYL